MAFAKSLHHAAFQLSCFLDEPSQRLLLLVSKTVHDACRPFQKTLEIPFCEAAQWQRVVGRFHHVEKLRLYPNVLEAFQQVNLTRLVHLDVTACGLASHNIPSALTEGLKKASNLQHFIVNQNALLQTSGLAKLLRALAKSNAFLVTLQAIDTGIRRLPLVDKPLLSRITSLGLSKNKLSESAIQCIFHSLQHLENAGFDIFKADFHSVWHHDHVKMISWWRCSPSELGQLVGCPRIVSASLFCQHPGQWSWTPAMGIGANLRHISIGSVYMSAACWNAFLETMAKTATIEELRLWCTNTPGEAFAKFVTAHRCPSALTSFAIAYNESFHEQDFMGICRAMHLREMTMKKWIIKGCRSLRLAHSAQDFTRTLSPTQPVHLDIAASRPVSLSTKAESQWFNHLFQHTGCFSYLDISQRSVILEDDISPNLFSTVENLCLRNTEINWGLDVPMPLLRNLCLANVQSQVYSVAQLLQQALGNPRLAHVKMDYCYLDHFLCPHKARHIHTLGLDWVSADDQFYKQLGDAIARKHFPSLTYLYIMRAPPEAACKLVAAMKGGQRRCHIDARSKRWTQAFVEMLSSVLAELQPGDVSVIKFWVEPPALPCIENLTKKYPCIFFDIK